MVKLARALSQIRPRKVFVVGDLLLDTYTKGKAERISPEAPVAVLQVESEEHRPGGAGNVILNLLSLGVDVVCSARIGCDSVGEILKNTLEEKGVDIQGLVVQEDYPTPVKNRIIANNQQIVRVDHEKIMSLSTSQEKQLLPLIPKLLHQVDAIAISDYGKGFLTNKLLEVVIEEGKKRGIPIIADPKGIDFNKYSGATIVKPNLGETYAAANLPKSYPLDEAARRILETVEMDVLMVTRSGEGISLFSERFSRQDFSVRIREVNDVTGAGDTVLAVLAWGLANSLDLADVTELSNLAAGIAIERLGCARVTLAELATRLLECDVKSKVFEAEHLFALLEALKQRTYSLISISSEEGFTPCIYQALSELKGDGHDVLVFIRDVDPSDEFIDILTSLHEVDFLIYHHEEIHPFYEQLNPEQIMVVEKGRFFLVEDLSLQGVL